MTLWLFAALGLCPPLAVGILMCARGPVAARLAATQLVSAIAIPLVVCLTFVLSEASSIDMALILALLGLPATLLFAVFAERWL